MADAHLDHHFFQITTPRLGARPSLGSLADLEGDRLTEASLKLLFTSVLTADGKETDDGGWYVGRDSLGHDVVVFRDVREPDAAAGRGGAGGACARREHGQVGTALGRDPAAARPRMKPFNRARRVSVVRGDGHHPDEMVRRLGIEPRTY